ncbi:MAG TPA: FtsQ-type POTRA domain-containing protein [Terracidiphilus sp.]
MTTQRSPKNRSLDWGDDTSPEPPFRRVQQVVRPGKSPGGRNLPGMPLTMPDPDDEEFPRPGRRQFDPPPAPWWRPSTAWGRTFLGLGVLVIFGTLGTAAFLFKTYLERDARFRITGSGNIQASGLNEVTRGDVLPVFGEDIGRNVFFVPLSLRRKQLEKIPWVEHATVMRLLPDQLRISLVERTPVAFVRQGQQIGLVDANGILLTMPAAAMTKHHYSFPVVTGIDAGDPVASRRARMAVYGRLIAELDSSGQHLSEQLSEIDLTDPEDARVLMPEEGADILAHFGDDQFLARYQRYKAHIAEWRQQYPKLAAVDLRYEQQVVLQMTPGAGGPQTTTNDGKPLAEPAAAASDGKPTKPSAGVKAGPEKTVAARAAVHKAAGKPKKAKEKAKKHPTPPRRPVAGANQGKAVSPAQPASAQGQ